MSGSRSLALVAVGGALLFMLAEEIAAARPWFGPGAPPTRVTPSWTAPTLSVETAPDTNAILARPLFNWNRRPPQRNDTGSSDDGLPRLSGIIVASDGRFAIFVASSDAKPSVVQEGKTIGRYRVEHIAADHVELTGPSGPQTLHTSFTPPPPPRLQLPDAS